jgi:predicted nucleic acid-binding protein
MNVYFDASPPMRAILRDGPVLAEWGQWDVAVTSAIFSVEARRTLDRLRLTLVYDDSELADAMMELLTIERSFSLLAVSDDVLERASRPMPTTVRTLDAIHLASAMVIRDEILPDLVFATHDRQQATGARALGFEVIGVTW